MSSVLQDVRYAVRQLMRAPGFTATVVVTLALGIGANAAIFTIFDQVLLRTLPVENPKALVRFEWTGAFSGSMSSFGGEAPDRHNYFSYPMYKDMREKNSVFSGILAADRCNLGISWHDQAENKDAEIVSGNYFELLGLTPAVGRLFSMNDETAKDANPVAVLSFEYWKTRFNEDRNVAGKTVLINGHAFTIAGVAPEGFHSAIDGYKPAVFVPITMEGIAMPWRAPIEDLTNRNDTWITLVARLKPGVTRQQAESGMAPLWYSLRAEELKSRAHVSASFKSGFLDHSHLSVVDDSTGFMPERSDLRTPLLVLLGMVFVLAAMCAVNVATLLLLRATGRVREISMRYALGAARTRVIRQLLVEGGALGLLGAVAGVALSPMIAGALVRMLSNSDEVADAPYSATVDARILGFTLALSVLVTILFSIVPALQFLRPRLAESLRQSAGTASKSSQRFRKIAVGLQIALTVLLLGGAGLFLRTLGNLRGESVGFQTTRLVSFDLDPTLAGYDDARTALVELNALDAIRAMPGVQFAAGTTDPEIAGNSNGSNFTVEGHNAAENEDMDFEVPLITASYFATLRQPLLAGREIGPGDTIGSPKVAVVNLAFAKRFFGTPQDAIGHRIAEGAGDKIVLDTMIVGVVGDVRHRSMREQPKGTVYRPYLQQKHALGLRIYALTSQDPKYVESAIRDRIHRLDPKLVADGLLTMEEQLDRSVSSERTLATLAMSFAGLALLMTAVGLYGVLAFATAQRTREIGVRMALGAQRSSVVMLVMREMALTAVIGVVVALPVAFALSRLVTAQLYGVQPGDPLTLAGCVAVSAVMVVLAAAIPARRAASVDPMKALRSE